jgi:hypothetical protein
MLAGILRMKFRTGVKIRDFLDCGQAQNESSSPHLAAATVPASETTTIFDEE